MSSVRREFQSDLVRKSQIDDPMFAQTFTEKLTPPGVQTLHTKSREEISEVIANILKSRAGIISFYYAVGSHFEITYQKV